MNQKFTLSIITLSNNSLEELKRTFESINKQNKLYFSFMEWCIIDNNSKDGTKEFLKSIKNKYLNINLVSEPDKGIYDAMDKGSILCKGKYIIYINSGDTLYNNHTLEFIINFINSLNKDHILLFGANRIHHIKNKLINFKKYPKQIFYINWGMPTNHQSIIYPKSLFKKIKFDSNFRVAGDYDHLCRCYKSNYPMKTIKIIISNFYMDGISNQSKFLDLAYQEVISIKKKTLKQSSTIIKIFILINYLHLKITKLIKTIGYYLKINKN